MSDELRFYTDTHISKQVALQLRQRDVDIVRCEDVGMAEADDEAHLSYATQENRVFLTIDKGFRARSFRWLAENREHSGIIIAHPDLQGKGGIGTMIDWCLFFRDAVKEGAATLDNFKNNVHYIP